MEEMTMKFTNREATQMVESALDDLDYDLDYDLNFLGRKWIESLDEVKTFYEYVYFYAHKKGFKGEESDADGLAKFVFECGNERNVTLSSLNTLKNWLKKAPPSGSQQGREKVYALCFALGLDASKTEEFFLKAYLERPFNYKNINEAVYFFCLKNKLPYSKAKEMIQKIEAKPDVENKDAEQVTEQVGLAISKMNSEDELIKYLVENRSAFEKTQNQTAIAKIKELYEECKELAIKEHKRLHINDNISVKSIDDLLEAITGYNARATYEGKKVYKTSISKSKLPAAVRKNFPQREQFKQVEQFKQNEKDTASFDVIRKFLIMLKFYHFFANALIENAEELEKNSFFREFVDETNEMLAKCGYVQLYLRNPYDAVFAYCAYGAANPLDEFKNVIYEFYLSDNEDE